MASHNIFLLDSSQNKSFEHGFEMLPLFVVVLYTLNIASNITYTLKWFQI